MNIFRSLFHFLSFANLGCVGKIEYLVYFKNWMNTHSLVYIIMIFQLKGLHEKRDKGSS